jgi:hypothetical protein
MRLIIRPTVLSHCLPIVNLALYQLLDSGNSRRPAIRALALLTFASVVIRAELAALLASFAIQLLLDRRISLTRLIKVGLVSSLVSVGVSLVFAPAYARAHTLAVVTVSIDSYFWDHWLWPELYSIYFNVYEGKSAEWGVSIFFIWLLRISPYSGISILDILHNPPSPSHGDCDLHPGWFYARYSHPGTRPTLSSLHLSHEFPRAQRMALRCVCCSTIEHRRCTWRPDPVCFFITFIP